jgi:hypothetical protein
MHPARIFWAGTFAASFAISMLKRAKWFQKKAVLVLTLILFASNSQAEQPKFFKNLAQKNPAAAASLGCASSPFYALGLSLWRSIAALPVVVGETIMPPEGHRPSQYAFTAERFRTAAGAWRDVPDELCFDVFKKISNRQGYKISDPAVSYSHEPDSPLTKSMD